MNIHKTNNPHIPASEIAKHITHNLDMGRKVLWLVAGGSSMSVAVEASKQIPPHPLLKILLTDERYEAPGAQDSNEAQLQNLGFTLPITSVLTGDSKEVTIQNMNQTFKQSIEESDSIIALFGVGPDGHVAGIMPESPATDDTEYAVGYQAPTFYRLTMTPKAIQEIDSAYLWMQGENKREAFERLQTTYNPALQPGQYLKEAGEFIVYTDIQ